jgi:hypothetical protein
VKPAITNQNGRQGRAARAIMQDEGFDIGSVMNRLKSEFVVEQRLPTTLVLWLEELHRRETNRVDAAE